MDVSTAGVLFVMPYSYINVVVGELSRNGGHVGLSVMIGEEHFRLDHSSCVDKLARSHGVWLVAWHEGDVDVADARHLRNVLGVSRDIDSNTVDSEDEAVVTSFWVELGVSLSGVICRHSFNGNVVDVGFVTVLHDQSVTNLVSTTLVGDEFCFLLSKSLDGRLVEMVSMLVCDEYVVGLRHGGIVHIAVSEFVDRVDLNLLAIEFDAYASMHNRMELERLSALGFEYVDLIVAGGDLHPGFFPRFDASFEVDGFESLFRKQPSRVGRPSSASAVDGYGLFLGELLQCIVDEVAFLDVDVDGSGEVSLTEFICSSDIEQCDVGLIG